MKSIMDLKNERIARWEQAKEFLEKNRDPKTGLVNAAAVERFNGMAAGNKVMLFGDFSYYWIADRGRRMFQRLDELFAVKDCTGFKVTERVDGRLILKDAMKALKVKE